MKKIILITLIIIAFSLTGVYAQTDYRDAFMGTWIWYNNTDTFRIKFKKAIFNIDGDVPGLYGYHEYKSGSKVLESSLKNYNSDSAMKLFTLKVFWWYEQEKPNNIVTGRIADVEYKDNMYMKRSLELTLSPNKKSMQFEARDRERTMLTTGTETPNELLPKDRKTFFFPKEATFIKEDDMPVVVVPSPTISTVNYTNLGFYSATLNGTIHPKGNKNVAVYFDYGTTTTAYSKRVEATPALVSGNTPVYISANISELSANNTTYHYRSVSIANGNVYYGEDKTFTTPYDAPTLQLLPPQKMNNMDNLKIGLRGSVNPHNLGEAKVYFEYSLYNVDFSMIRVEAIPRTISGKLSTNVSVNISAINYDKPILYRMVCIVGGKTHYTPMDRVTIPQPPKDKPYY